tara:strand:+ start:550 stop:819 length:270 start_codon:yes stop_codon:yes gene_type:complete
MRSNPQSKVRDHAIALKAEGVRGQALFDALADYELALKLAALGDRRCARCWHDAASRCVCPHLDTLISPPRSCSSPRRRLPMAAAVKVP